MKFKIQKEMKSKPHPSFRNLLFGAQGIKELNAEKLEKAEVFTNLFPLFDIQLIEEFSNFFSKKTFCLDEVIYSQDGPSQNLYLLKTGEVKLLCDFHGGTEPTSPQSGGKKNISVVSVVKNQVFGEEVLLTP